MVLTYSPTKNDIECYYSSETGFVISFQHHGFMNKKWVCSSIQVRTSAMVRTWSYYRNWLYRVTLTGLPKVTIRVQTEKDFFQPEIRFHIQSETGYFLTIFLPIVPQGIVIRPVISSGVYGQQRHNLYLYVILTNHRVDQRSFW